jgi:predicted transcriptional regulator
MTAKEEILELMKQIPDDLTVDEALERLQLLYDVHKGLEEAERGEVVSHEQAKKMIEEWLQ